jgi:hypothetical protein
MNKSESIIKLAPALVKAQASIGTAFKNRENTFLKGAKYADLEAVWEAASGVLRDNKLAVLQLPSPTEKPGFFEMETILMHDSGEWIGSTISIPCPKQDPQGYGSAMTYARRYALAAMLGIVQSDDDGEGAKTETEKAIDAIEAINTSQTEEELKRIFIHWFRALEGNTNARKVLIQAKDRKKEELQDATA